MMIFFSFELEISHDIWVCAKGYDKNIAHSFIPILINQKLIQNDVDYSSVPLPLECSYMCAIARGEFVLV